MRVSVHFFAAARELAGREQMELEIPVGCRVADLRQQLALEVPRLAALLERCRLALNDDFATDDQPVPAAARLAVLPPVGGG
jgi:molybdopterin converting factor subunit 1